MLIRGPLPLFQEFSWLSLVHCLQNCFLLLPAPQLGPPEQQVSRRKHGQERAEPGVNCSKAWRTRVRQGERQATFRCQFTYAPAPAPPTSFRESFFHERSNDSQPHSVLAVIRDTTFRHRRQHIKGAMCGQAESRFLESAKAAGLCC